MLLHAIVSISVVDGSHFVVTQGLIRLAELNKLLGGIFVTPDDLRLELVWGEGAYGFLSGWNCLLSFLYAFLISDFRHSCRC